MMVKQLNEMPWYALPLSSKEQIDKLEDLCEADTIPRLTILADDLQAAQVLNCKNTILKGEPLEDVF